MKVYVVETDAGGPIDPVFDSVHATRELAEEYVQEVRKQYSSRCYWNVREEEVHGV